MAYDLNEFCEDCKNAIRGDSQDGGHEAIRLNLEKLLHNSDFVAENCGQDAEIGVHTLYQDADLDFMVLAHINDKGRVSPPHDHGSSWAIYGQAQGVTKMIEYDRIDHPANDRDEEGPAEVKVRNKYALNPGDAGTFAAHKIHSIDFTDGAKFVRVTGTDLSKITSKRFDTENGTVILNIPNTEGRAAGTTS
jgi:predicted metal-dependent enzyme (double-stranded beta helix superfamily)